MDATMQGGTSTHAEGCTQEVHPTWLKNSPGIWLRRCWKWGHPKCLWTMESSQLEQNGHTTLGTLPVEYCLIPCEKRSIKHYTKEPYWFRVPIDHIPPVSCGEKFSRPWKPSLCDTVSPMRACHACTMRCCNNWIGQWRIWIGRPSWSNNNPSACHDQPKWYIYIYLYI